MHTGNYNKVRIDISYGDHPNTSDNKATTDAIKKMNDDALYGGHQFYGLDDADTIINHKGAIKPSAEKPMYAFPSGAIRSPDEFDDPDNADDVWSEEENIVDADPPL